MADALGLHWVHRRDRAWFVRWRLVTVAATVNLLACGNYLCRDPRIPAVAGLALGALAVLCPLAARALGHRLLTREVSNDPGLPGMVLWRLLCIGVALFPSLALMPAVVLWGFEWRWMHMHAPVELSQ